MSLPQRVTKTHATGNDFVVYLDKSGKFEPTADEVRFLCDRHFGIGGDGLIRLTRPDFVSDLSDDQLSDVLAGGAKWFMDYRNADGSLAEMCGNGTRAITKPVVAPVIESDQNVEFVRVDDIDQSTGVGEATMRVNERGCGETLSCGTGLCATGIVLRAKTGISHWDITVRGGTLRVDVTDSDVKLTGAATLVADIDLL